MNDSTRFETHGQQINTPHELPPMFPAQTKLGKEFAESLIS
jgi:hypothetical protein